MSNESFKIGDLVLLSKFGLTVIRPNEAKVGVVISGPTFQMYKCLKSDAYVKYSTYDAMFGKELLTDVPEEFLERMGDDNHAENPKGLESLSERGEPKE